MPVGERRRAKAASSEGPQTRELVVVNLGRPRARERLPPAQLVGGLDRAHNEREPAQLDEHRAFGERCRHERYQYERGPREDEAAPAGCEQRRDVGFDVTRKAKSI